MKAVFLDRDGVVNIERGDYTYKLEDFILNDGLIEFCIKAKEKGFLLFIISNQGGIAKGIYSLSDVEILNDYIENELKKKGIEITDFYFCPHHNDFGACLCRKPNSILLEKVMAKYHIDVQHSFMIGDRERDIEAAKKIGLKGILIESNTDLRNFLNFLD